MVNLYNDAETPLDVRHAGGVAYVLQPGLNVDVPDVPASFARAQYPDLVRRVPAVHPPSVPAVSKLRNGTSRSNLKRLKAVAADNSIVRDMELDVNGVDLPGDRYESEGE